MVRDRWNRSQGRFPGPWVLTAAAVMVALSVFPVTATANVLEQVPSDAAVVIRIGNLKEVSAKVASFAQQWGIVGFRPELGDPLAAFKDELGISKGLAEDGEVAVYCMTVPLNREEPVPVVLLPVSDYEAFLGNFPDSQKKGDLAAVTLKTGDRAFIAHRGNYAMIGINPESLASPEKLGLKTGAAATRELETKDVVAHVNFDALSTQLQPEIDARRQQMTLELDRISEGAATDQAPADAESLSRLVPVLKAIAGQIVSVAEGALRGGESATWGVALSDAGVASTFITDFRPDTYPAGIMAKLKPSDAAHISGLPEGQYLAIGGYQVDQEVMKTLVTDFLAPIRRQLDDLGDEVEPFAGWLESAETYVTSSSDYRFGALAPPGGPDSGTVHFLSLMTGDAAALAQAQHKLLASQDTLINSVMSGWLGGEADVPPGTTTSLTPDAMTIEGVNFTQFQTNLNPGQGGQDMIEQILREMLASIGGGKASGMFGVVDPQHFMVTSGGNEEMVAAAVIAARADEKAMTSDARLMAAGKQLPPERLGVLYLSIDQIARSGVAAAQANGMEVELEVPKNLEPFAFGISTEGGTGVRIDGYFPAQTLQSLVAIGMQVGMQFRAGMQAGTPGDL